MISKGVLGHDISVTFWMSLTFNFKVNCLRRKNCTLLFGNWKAILQLFRPCLNLQLTISWRWNVSMSLARAVGISWRKNCISPQCGRGRSARKFSLETSQTLPANIHQIPSKHCDSSLGQKGIIIFLRN